MPYFHYLHTVTSSRFGTRTRGTILVVITSSFRHASLKDVNCVDASARTIIMISCKGSTCNIKDAFQRTFRIRLSYDFLLKSRFCHRVRIAYGSFVSFNFCLFSLFVYQDLQRNGIRFTFLSLSIYKGNTSTTRGVGRHAISGILTNVREEVFLLIIFIRLKLLFRVLWVVGPIRVCAGM